MKSLFSFVKPQIAFGAGGRGGGSRGSGIKPTGFADQASRMANSQRQLGAPQMPGFNLEAEKDVPSVAKRKSSRDNSPIDTGSGDFSGGFQKSPKSGSGGGSSYGSDPNPFRSAFGSSKGSGTSSTQTGRLDLSGIGGANPIQQGALDSVRTAPVMNKAKKGVTRTPMPRNKIPAFGSQGTSKPVGLPRTPMPDPGGRPTPPRPSPIFDDFIPRNPDGSPKYTAPDGSPLRRPYDPSQPTPAKPRSDGGKGGGGIARPPKRPSTPTQPKPTPPTPGPDMPTRRPIPRDAIGTPQPMPYGGKGGAGPMRPSTPVPRRDPVMVDPRNPTGAPDPVDPIQQIAVGRQQQFPTGPSRYAPGTAGGMYQLREFGVPRQGGRPSVPMNDQRAFTPAPNPMPMPYGGKGGGARPPMQQRRPQMPFTYYRPRR